MLPRLSDSDTVPVLFQITYATIRLPAALLLVNATDVDVPALASPARVCTNAGGAVVTTAFSVAV